MRDPRPADPRPFGMASRSAGRTIKNTCEPAGRYRNETGWPSVGDGQGCWPSSATISNRRPGFRRGGGRRAWSGSWPPRWIPAGQVRGEFGRLLVTRFPGWLAGAAVQPDQHDQQQQHNADCDPEFGSHSLLGRLVRWRRPRPTRHCRRRRCSGAGGGERPTPQPVHRRRPNSGRPAASLPGRTGRGPQRRPPALLDGPLVSRLRGGRLGGSDVQATGVHKRAELSDHLVQMLVADCRILGHQVGHHLRQRLRHADRLQRLDRLGRMLVHFRSQIAAGKRRLARQQFVQRAAQRVDVRQGVGRFAILQELRREVIGPRRQQSGRRPAGTRTRGIPADRFAEQLDVAALFQPQAAGTNVAVRQPR